MDLVLLEGESGMDCRLVGGGGWVDLGLVKANRRLSVEEGVTLMMEDSDEKFGFGSDLTTGGVGRRLRFGGELTTGG